VKDAADFGQIVTGGTPKTENREYWGGDIPWVTPTDITDRRDIQFSERMITESGFDQLRPLPKNTLLVTCIASIGKNAILTAEGACNQQINAIIPSPRYSVRFLYYLIELHKDYLIGNAGITATLIISKRDFSAIPFSVPTLTEQTAIAEVLSDMDADLAALEARVAKARAVKQGMMQQLLTGKVRLV
jgi:type I restriction enzyme S subunit